MLWTLVNSTKWRCVLIVVGLVTRVQQLEAKDGREPLDVCTIEGFNLLISKGVEPPPSGRTVRADVSHHFPKGGGRPQHWLGAWSEVTFA